MIRSQDKMKKIVALASSTLIVAITLLTAAKVMDVDVSEYIAMRWNMAKNIAGEIARVVGGVDRTTLGASISGPGSGIVGYWKFDEGTGGTTADSSGFGNTGTLVGVEWSEMSPFDEGESVSLFESLADVPSVPNDYITVPDSNELDIPGSFTISAWVNTSNIGPTAPHVQAVAVKGVEETDRNYSLAINYYGEAYGLWVQIKGCSFNNGIAMSQSIPASEWANIVVRYDHSASPKRRDVFLSNLLVHTETAAVCEPAINSSPLIIGGAPTGNSNFTTFKGLIDDLRIFNRPLTDGEIGQIYNETQAPARFNGSPSGALSSGLTEVELLLNTNETATCKMSTTANIPYASMTDTFSVTGSTAHSEWVSVESGQSYEFYVRCADTFDKVNADDYVIAFSIDGDVELQLNLYARVKSDTTADVREAAGLTAPVVPGSPQPPGKKGQLTNGPVSASGLWWWYVNFHSGVDGWVKENDLVYRSIPPLFFEWR